MMLERDTRGATSLLRLRAEMVRIANEVDGLADLASIVNVRTHAPILAEKIRNAVMRAETKVDPSMNN